MTGIIIQAISTSILAISVIYAGRQITLLRKQHGENHDWNRRIAAQQAIREYREIQASIEDLSHHFDYHNRTEGVAADNFNKKFEEVKHLQTSLHTALNYFEGLARGVRQGIYDEEVVKNAFHGSMISVYECFKYYICSRRKKWDNQKLWFELEALIDKWKQEERVTNPDRPILGA